MPAIRPSWTPEERERFSYSRLDPQQRRVADQFLLFVQQMDEWAAANRPPRTRPVVPHIAVLGGPGTGKSHLAQTLGVLTENRHCTIYGAPHGSPASLLPAGMTHYARLDLPVVEGKGQQRNHTLDALDIAARLHLARGLHGVLIFVMDEISLMDAVMLAHISQRLSDIRQLDEPMGGIATLLLGDPRQLPSTSGLDLFAGLVEARVFGATPPPGSPLAHGLDLFERYSFKELSINHRSLQDSGHMGILDRVVAGGLQPIDDVVLEHIPVLTQADIASGEWDTATFVTTENESRCAIDHLQATRYAAANGLPVIMWHNELTARSRSRFNAEELEEIYTNNPTVCGHFIPGAPAYLTQNIHPARRAANGNLTPMHGLLINPDLDPLDAARQLEQIMEAPPGVTTRLEHPPAGVAVKIPAASCADWPAHLRLTPPPDQPDTVLVPVIMHPRFPTATRIRPVGQYVLGTEVRQHRLEVELGFCVTYHKVQGRTVDKIVLDLGDNPRAPLTFHHLWVGMTRVRQQADLRRLPFRDPIRDAARLKALRVRPQTLAFLQGIDSSGQWQSSLALDYLRANGDAKIQRRLARRATHSPISPPPPPTGTPGRAPPRGRGRPSRGTSPASHAPNRPRTDPPAPPFRPLPSTCPSLDRRMADLLVCALLGVPNPRHHTLQDACPHLHSVVTAYFESDLVASPEIINATTPEQVTALSDDAVWTYLQQRHLPATIQSLVTQLVAPPMRPSSTTPSLPTTRPPTRHTYSIVYEPLIWAITGRPHTRTALVRTTFGAALWEEALQVYRATIPYNPAWNELHNRNPEDHLPASLQERLLIPDSTDLYSQWAILYQRLAEAIRAHEQGGIPHTQAQPTEVVQV
jgi:hypothetical protein